MQLQHLDDWQKEILATEGDFLLCTGRQVGKTTIMAIKAAERLVKQPGCQIIIASLTEDQAQLIIIMALDYLQQHYKPYLKKAKKATKNQIWLNNKSFMLARPVGNTGDAIRGFTGHVLILDENSRMNEMIMTAAKPVLLTTGGELWICSTPFGKQGFFWGCFQNKANRFKVFHISSEEVISKRPISDFWTQKKRDEALAFLQREKEGMTALQYGQEYLGLFLEDFNQLFSDKLLDKVCRGERIAPYQGGKFYLGVDVARYGGDEITYEVVDMKDKKSLRHIQNIVKKNQTIIETFKDIVELQQQYRFRKIYIDSGGIGAGVFDLLMRESSTKMRTEAIDNATKAMNQEEGKRKLRKEELYFSLLGLMERGEITILDDEKVRLSLKSIQHVKDVKEGQKPRDRIFGSYSHIAEGLVRAAWCAQTKDLNLWVRWK